LLLNILLPIGAFCIAVTTIVSLIIGITIDINTKNAYIITNPLIIASIIGLFFIYFKIKLPTPIEKTINDISKIATPLAFILLGSSFTFSAFSLYIKQLSITILGKLIIVPGIVLYIAALLGFRNIELTCLLSVFASPTAVSSYTMAEQMDGDSILAGQIVVLTSIISIITVFLWIFILKQTSLI